MSIYHHMFALIVEVKFLMLVTVFPVIEHVILPNEQF